MITKVTTFNLFLPSRVYFFDSSTFYITRLMVNLYVSKVYVSLILSDIYINGKIICKIRIALD